VRAELNIEGMHRDAYAGDIRTRLEATAGVHDVDVTFKRETAIVDFDDNVVGLDTLLTNAQDLGNQATVGGQPQKGVGA
jgi:copper chaperone CopZ